MTGKKETLIEKMTKPLRISPAGAFGLITGAAYIALGHELQTNAQTVELGVGAGLIFYSMLEYPLCICNYLRARKVAKGKNLVNMAGRRLMQTYCGRQAFNIACIENGYRDEAKTIIDETPNFEKNQTWMPHF